VHIVLKNNEIIVSEKIIRAIMKEQKLKTFRKKMSKYNSYDKRKDISYAPNLLNRYFDTNSPGKKAVTDITEFKIEAGKVYLSPLIDLYDGCVVSHKAGVHPDQKLVNDMIEKGKKKLKKKCKVHSDRGVQYHAYSYRKKLRENGFKQSMSKKGCSPDNSVAEGFFGILKNEFFYNRDFSGMTKKQFIKELNKYIHWYNNERIKTEFKCSIVENRKRRNITY
jgi:transposase InsO family protein